MELRYHTQITRQALETLFSAVALQKIISANLYQDRLAAQIGHDEYHFDNDTFEQGYAYIEEQRRMTIASLQAKDAPSAWSAFGRLTHSVQDFYAHSNYVDLWLSYQNATVPTPPEIDPVDPALIRHPRLHSGRIYMPLELFSFIKPLKPLVKPLLPRNSHAWMNLDSPEQGPSFGFAFHAAVKRTRIEFEITKQALSPELLAIFTDRSA